MMCEDNARSDAPQQQHERKMTLDDVVQATASNDAPPAAQPTPAPLAAEDFGDIDFDEL